MALDAQQQLHFENMGFSQNCLMNMNMNMNMNTIDNLSPLPAPLFDTQPLPQPLPTPQMQQQRFVQGFGEGMGMGMGMGMGFDGQNQGFVSATPCCSSSVTGIGGSGGYLSPQNSFAALVQKQRSDLDQYLQLQGAKLRQMLQQQRKQELSLLLKSLESRAMALIREKDEHLQKLTAKTKILEDCLQKAEQEIEEWQKLAREKEQIAIGLNNMIEQLKSNLYSSTPQITNHEIGHEIADNDAESVCDFEPLKCKIKNRGGGETGEERENGGGLNCKCRWCNSSSCNVVFFPCKHLCCCKNCDALLLLCPICHSLKQNSIEIFFS